MRGKIASKSALESEYEAAIHARVLARLRLVCGEAPGVFSQGETLEKLEANIRDAYELMREES